MVDWQKHPGQPEPGDQPSVPPPYPPGYGYPAYPPGYGYPPPPYGYGPPPGLPKPSSNIGWAIAALLTFWPLGIPSIIASTKVDDLWFRGDIAGAQKASADARKWGLAAVLVSVGFFLLMILFLVVVFGILAHDAGDLNDGLPAVLDLAGKLWR